MPRTRRTFLTAAAAAAAGLAFPASRFGLFAATRGPGARPYLDLAVRCATWIDASGQEGPAGRLWPADPLKPGSVSYDYYNGMPGVVAFLAALHDATGDVRWLNRAGRGAASLVAVLDADADRLDSGLYTGLAGLAWTLRTVARVARSNELDAAAARAEQRLVERSAAAPASWDIISGAAGTGLYLLSTGTPAGRAAAIRAGDALLAVAEPAGAGRMWFPGPNLRRNYPNFSHGTAGVGYFLATLHQQTGERRFLDGALSGAAYLESVATRRDGATTIFHTSGGGENRFYLSWCHGPVGTARLFHRLHQITGEARWMEWTRSLTRGVFTSGAPEGRTEGYWNNISQCCGNVGIGQYCVDLARYLPSLASEALQTRVLENTMARATDDQHGLRWVQAENRTEPENLVAQTGFMQGAAGVGTFLLQLDALEGGRAWRWPFPDTPFQG